MWHHARPRGGSSRYVAIGLDVTLCVRGQDSDFEIGDKALHGDVWRYIAIRGDVTRCLSLTCL